MEFLPESQQIRDMIALPTPDGDVVYYPANLVLLATQGTYSCFQSMSFKSGNGYLITTQPTTARFHLIGPPEQIAKVYEETPWREVMMSDGKQTFLYKIAPSLKELNDYFEQFKDNEKE